MNTYVQKIKHVSIIKLHILTDFSLGICLEYTHKLAQPEVCRASFRGWRGMALAIPWF